jgi:hypothetical protein
MGRFGAVISGIGALAGRAAPYIGTAIQVIAGLATAAVGAYTAMLRFTDSLVRGNYYLAAYNGQIAISYTRLAYGDFWRNVEVSNRLAPQMKEFLEAVNQQRNAFQEYRIGYGIFETNLGQVTSGITEAVAKAFEPIAQGANSFFGSQGFLQFMTDYRFFLVKMGEDFGDGLRAILKAFGIDIPKKPDDPGHQGPWDRMLNDIIMGRIPGGVIPPAGAPRRDIPPLAPFRRPPRI